MASRAALTLSGEEADGAVNVDLLRDIRAAFGDDDEIRSVDLLVKLTADPERPWADWKNGRPLTQKQLAGLLRPFNIISETVHPPGLPDGKGYKRAHFEDGLGGLLPWSKCTLRPSWPFRSVQASKCR